MITIKSTYKQIERKPSNMTKHSHTAHSELDNDHIIGLLSVTIQ